MKNSIFILLPFFIGCAAPIAYTPGTQSTDTRLQRANIIQGITDSNYKYSPDRTELLITLEKDTGETGIYSTLRRPVNNVAVVAETTLKRDNIVVSRRATTVEEAQLVLKTAANNGWQQVYFDLKKRYQLAGLIN